MKEEPEVFDPKTLHGWRKWLEENHQSKNSVWLVYYSKASGKDTISWSEAVDMALCFGWIDSKKVKIDAETSHQFFSKRRSKSIWSKINKDKINKLEEAGLMSQAGWEAVEIAKKNGSWTAIDEAETLLLPKDLELALSSFTDGKQNFEKFSKSSRKAILQWLLLAKRPETRQKRIAEIAELASEGKKPKQF